jgi:hypothetical protein
MSRHRSPAPRCSNCGAQARGRYCPHCGQDSRDHRVATGVLLREFWADVFSLDSRFLRTLGLLVTRPGELTAEYMRGRRVRYLPPLRLYLIISIAFFLLLSMRVSLLVTREQAAGRAAPDSAAVAGVLEALRALPDSLGVRIPPGAARLLAAGAGAPDDSRRATGGHWVVMGRDVSDVKEQVLQGTVGLAPKAVFVLLPLFAGLLALVYWRSRRMFIEHAIFSLHTHAFLFLAFAAGLLLPRGWIWAALAAGFPIYLFLAMRRVYGQGVFKTLLKLGLLLGAYGMALVFVLGSTAIMATQLIDLGRRHPWLQKWLLG